MAQVRTIDLGALQDNYDKARKQFEEDRKSLERIQHAYTKSKNDFANAREALAQATRVVLE